MTSVFSGLPLFIRLALRDMRGGVRGFRIFLACLAVGVAAIAAAGSMNRAVQEGLAADAQALLGGDLMVRLLYRPATEEEDAALRSMATTSLFLEMRSMARAQTEEARRTLIELKGVDDLYPLYGSFDLMDGSDLADALAIRDGIAGAVVAPNLLGRLGVDIGDRLAIGDSEVEIRAVIQREPDEVATPFSLGPRVIVSQDVVRNSNLIMPGSLIRYQYLLRTDKTIGPSEVRQRLNTQFPEAGWQIQGTDQAASGMTRFLGQLTMFLVLVGLTSLLVGGIGVANAVKAYLDGRIRTIAAFKCMGAPAGMVMRIYATQLTLLSAIGIAIGVAIGASAPFILTFALENVLPVQARPALYWQPLSLAIAFGFLTALVFALWPLGLARDIPATALFRSASQPLEGRPRTSYLLGVILSGIALAALAIVTARQPALALWFVGGSVAAMALFRVAAYLVAKLAKALSHPSGRPALRLAITNLHRPGAATTSVILSLGLGLSVLVAVALIQGNLSRQFTETMPDNAPSYFFIDIQPHQVDPFKDIAAGIEGADQPIMADMLRGRIVSLKDQSAQDIEVDPDVRWVLRGDRGFTTTETIPAGSEIVSGDWWTTEQAATESLFSVTHDIAVGLGLEIGDPITVNILGRDISGTLANTRKVQWQSLAMNFSFAVTPAAFAGAPRTFIATINVPQDSEAAIERSVTDAMPNVSAIGVRQALGTVTELLEAASNAVRVAASVTLLSGAVVLAGAFAAGHRRRVYESVVLKVLGATRTTILRAYLTEYGIMGAATGLIAVVVGSAASWGVMTFVMRSEWAFLPGTVTVTLLACIAVTLLAGFAGTWQALGARSAPHLRNE